MPDFSIKPIPSVRAFTGASNIAHSDKLPKRPQPFTRSTEVDGIGPGEVARRLMTGTRRLFARPTPPSAHQGVEDWLRGLPREFDPIGQAPVAAVQAAPLPLPTAYNPAEHARLNEEAMIRGFRNMLGETFVAPDYSLLTWV